MTSTSTRGRKPVGSAQWIATEKENITQLVDQELEEMEYPVSHEMDWLNEHMAEIFNSNQLNFTEVFKTPGKMRGKTPRTARKRNVEASRVPLSEIFSTAHNQVENSNASPTGKRSPTKPAPPATVTTKLATDDAPQPRYPDLTQNDNLNSFPQYNTDSGYHDIEDGDNDGADGLGKDEDGMVFTQPQSESQASTQPFESRRLEGEQAPDVPQPHDSPEASFHSARQEREQTAEPTNIDSAVNQKIEVQLLKSQPQPQRESEPESAPAEPEQEHYDEPAQEPEVASEKRFEKESGKEPEPGPEQAPQREPEQKLDSEPEHAPEPERKPEPASEPEPKPVQDTKLSPVKTPATQPQPQWQEKKTENERNEMELDNLDDDIGSPSDGSTPERPPIRKSSLTFASLPAREPLMKTSLGGARISRTSHVDKPNTGSSFFGRQTGHRTTQTASDEHAQGDRMDVDEHNGAEQDSKTHSKSSTQTLHEMISKMSKGPSRPTKSIPSAPNLPSAQVSYPELPPVAKETKPDPSNKESRNTPPAEAMETDEEDWIQPLNTPQRPKLAKDQTMDVVEKNTNKAYEKDNAPMVRDQGKAKQDVSNDQDLKRVKSARPTYSSPQHPNHQKSASVSNLTAQGSTTPVGSPAAQEPPLSASKWKLHSIMKSAKGLFSNSGSASDAAKAETSSPDEQREQSKGSAKTHRAAEDRPVSQPSREPTPKQEGRRTRSSTEQKRKQKEEEDRQRDEQTEKAREQEMQKANELKATQEKAAQEQRERAGSVFSNATPAAPKLGKIPQTQKHSSKEIEPTHEIGPKSALPTPASQAQKPHERRLVRPAREPVQKPRLISVPVSSGLARQMPNVRESNAAPGPGPASATKPTIKKKGSNNSLHTAPSNSSFKSSVSSNTQRKAQLASERKKEQEEREARRKEEQKREMERKRAAQQQEEARRQELRNRAEAERREKERHPPEDPKKATHMQAIEKRRLENAKRLERQGSQKPNDAQPERPASQTSRPASRLGSVQPFGRSINQPQPNPAKPPKRAMDDEPGHRPAPRKPSAVQPSGEAKRRRTDEEHNPPPSVRPTMAPPIRPSNTILKEPVKPSIFKAGQPQRPVHPMDMAKYATGKIPFAEPSNASQPPAKAPAASSSQKVPPKPSPKYPSGESVHLPEIATDSEDEDSDSEMLPVPGWAQPKELETLLRQQEGMEVDSIFGPIAPFSLEDTFKTDKKIKKFRERTSSANWSGADRLTQDEIRKDLADRQRLRLNGGWTFDSN